MKPLEFKHFVCQCSDFDHDIRFVFDPDNGDLWLEVHLVNQSFWERLKRGLRYIFGRSVSGYDCTMIRPEDGPEIRKLLGEMERVSAEQAEARRLRGASK